jgi:Phosphotransferase enzyme family
VTIPAQPAIYTKHYRDAAARDRAQRNYWWLASLGSPLRLPRLLTATRQQLGFERITGRHAVAEDLEPLAAHLGQVHAIAHTARLCHIRLDASFTTASGHLIPGFLIRRLDAITRALGTGNVPGSALSTGQAERLLHDACGEPAAFYKDANPRNFLITATGPVTVDFDDLSLAPFGYDLAKLVITLAMTCGPLPASQITAALGAYNAATRQRCPEAGTVTWTQLMAWAEIHHILTSRYLGRSGYQHSWHELRPCPPQPPRDLEG